MAFAAREGRAAGEQIVGRAPEDRPDAIFAANDLVAVGLLQGLMLPGGIRVPAEIAVIGYDDIDFASVAFVPLSSIRQPTGMIGRTAVRMLLGLESGRTPVVFQPELVVRESTSPTR